MDQFIFEIISLIETKKTKHHCRKLQSKTTSICSGCVKQLKKTAFACQYPDVYVNMANTANILHLQNHYNDQCKYISQTH